ncbi:MAG: class I SAM-dependent methyltransferase [Sphaerochaetaceae bacterium]|nr:class I SAM-dependent methyltransferase [Sphaerochaetaceae bacterium]MDD4258640.1 class I SAM-dependent methyltransferase [Sphaerochaetaceae bacterium]
MGAALDIASSSKQLNYAKRAIKNIISVTTHTMLHLGCGAGGHDYHFKKHFKVTGVDVSQGMLDIAKKTNPDVTYVLGDMRSINLSEKFDAVVIPDSIAYMSTVGDLKQTLMNATGHLKTGGVLLVVAHTKEEFSEHNFVYTGSEDNIHITLFENNHIISDSTYEATMIYLIRKEAETSIHHETHTLGLFPYEQWLSIFKECQLQVEVINTDHLYDDYLLEEGEFKLKVFIGTLL